jgi:hypothetical protein
LPNSVLTVNKESEIRSIEGTIASPDPSPVSREEGEKATKTDEEGEAVYVTFSQGTLRG